MESYPQKISEIKLKFNKKIDKLRKHIENYNMFSNPETLIDIEKTIKDATDFIDKKKLAINVLIDNEAKDLTRKGYNKTQLQTAIDTAKTMVTDMGNQMESDLNKMKKSQIGYEEGKGEGK